MPIQIRAERTTIHAQFPGGKSALKKFIKTSKRKQLFSDSVIIPFTMTIGIIINKNGTINRDSIVINEDDRHLCESCSFEAKRLVRIMPDWIPAYCFIRGKKKYIPTVELVDMTFE